MPASFLLVSRHDSDDDPIVGFWRTKFVAKGNPDLPDGLVFDRLIRDFRSGTAMEPKS